MATVKLTIDGMHCGGCVRRVTAVLGRVPGVAVRDVQVGTAVVTVDPARGTPEGAVAALAEAGFAAAAEAADEPR